MHVPGGDFCAVMRVFVRADDYGPSVGGGRFAS